MNDKTQYPQELTLSELEEVQGGWALIPVVAAIVAADAGLIATMGSWVETE